MDEDFIPAKEDDKSKVYIIAGATLLIIVALFFLKPAITGYSTYNMVKNSNYSFDEYGKEIAEIKEEAVKAEEQLTNCVDNSQSMQQRLGIVTNQSERCLLSNEELRKRQDEMKAEYNQNMISINNKHSLDIAEVYENMDDMERMISDYSDIIEKAANNICCKAKVDDSRIDSYSIVDDEILCKKNGEKKISCVFD
jgi:chromosome segregation ATPase